MTGPKCGLSLGARVWLVALTLACPRALMSAPPGPDSLPDPVKGGVGRVVHEFGAVTPAMIDQLKAEVRLDVSPTREEGDIPLSLSPWEVISMRREYPEMAALAGNKMTLIQRLTIGAAPEFVAAGRMFALFYEGVARNSWSFVLRWRLRRAEAALWALTRQTKARQAYLDDFEWRMRGAPASGPFPAWLESSRLESYLDEAEKRFDKLESEKGSSHGITKNDT